MPALFYNAIVQIFPQEKSSNWRFNEAGDMLTACSEMLPSLTEVGDIFCLVIYFENSENTYIIRSREERRPWERSEWAVRP